jgi:hypothetical protein
VIFGRKTAGVSTLPLFLTTEYGFFVEYTYKCAEVLNFHTKDYELEQRQNCCSLENSRKLPFWPKAFRGFPITVDLKKQGDS